jgi:electron transport complex protein RnfC
MGLIKSSQIDRDFHGGIYLPPLGVIPSLEITTPTCYPDELLLPLRTGDGTVMQTTVAPGAKVQAATLLAHSPKCHYYLYAPCNGTVGQIVENQNSAGNCKTLLPLTTAKNGSSATDASASIAMTPQQAQKDALYKTIEASGIIITHTGKSLADFLQHHKSREITTVIANAAPLEPSLNSPLAILHKYPECVFAGLAILKQWLGANQAVMAYPYHLSIDQAAAEQWQVRCLPISEKYPQAYDSAILQTLQKQGHLPRSKHALLYTAVFDIQLLYQVERLVMASQLPTTRIVTVCGNAVEQPAHFLTPIGTPLSHLLKQATLCHNNPSVINGASMTGTAVDIDSSVVSYSSKSFTVIKPYPQRPSHRCIRCGRCIDVCPARIDAAGLAQLIAGEQYHQTLKLGLYDCIDCGICSYLCPSNIPIARLIHDARKKLDQELSKQK